MKKTTLLLITGLLIGCSGAKQSSNIPSASIYDFQETITMEGLKADLTIIASDEFEGRATGTEGIQKATDYITQRYTELGLMPVGDNGTYIQSYDLAGPVVNGYEYVLSNTEDGVISASNLNKQETGDFATIFGGTDNVDGEIVFAGLGMLDEEKGINHYPTDIEGKWLLVIFDAKSLNQRALQSVMAAGGASGVILVMDYANPATFDEAQASVQENLGRSGRLSLAYLQNNDRKVAAWNRVKPELGAQILGLESNEKVAELAETLKADPTNFEPKPLGFSLEHTAEVDQNIVEASNIAAFIEGSDPMLKDEVVVLSAHHDHVGIGRPDSTGDNLYNGADDDGSGTVGLLNAAQAMIAAKKAGAGPKRSVLFLHVSGEEMGLLGSRYYSDHPIFPIENTIANINVDMIGRVDKEHEDNKDYIYVIGGEIISSGIDSLMNEANMESVNLDLSKRYNDLEDPNQFYRRSDHWNFGRLGVPFVFFFNGTHDDYHRPSDEISKIEWEALTKRTKLVYMTTAKLANSAVRPEVDNQEFINKTKSQSRN